VVDTRIPPAVRHARVATSVVFAVHGAVMGTFAARVPWVADHVGVGVGGLAVALRTGEHPGRSLAGVAGIAYGSGLVAPGVIGGIGHVSSLTVSFGLVVLLTTAMGAVAGVLRPPPPTPPPKPQPKGSP
jgi:hypothetical protein